MAKAFVLFTGLVSLSYSGTARCRESVVSCPAIIELYSQQGDNIIDVAQKLSDLSGDVFPVSQLERDLAEQTVGGSCSLDALPIGTPFHYIIECPYS